MNSPMSCKHEQNSNVCRISALRVNEASVLDTNVGGTAGRYIDNPLVPFGMRGFFIFFRRNRE
jgi:hypothetical protein